MCCVFVILFHDLPLRPSLEQVYLADSEVEAIDYSELNFVEVLDYAED